jgi:quercetin dioxygenase-like cupin family protein
MAEGTHTLIAEDAEALLCALPIEAGKVRSRRIFAGTGATMVLLSLDAGETLKEHIAMTPILVQVLSGHVTFEVGRERIDLTTGAIIHLDANLPHAVEALTESHLLLTVFERGRSTPGGAKTPKERHSQAVAVAVAAPVPDAPGLSLPSRRRP